MRLILLFLLSVLFIEVSGQNCSDGSVPGTVTVNLAGLTSVDFFGDPDNEVQVLNAGLAGDVVGLEWNNVVHTPIGLSWCNEAQMVISTDNTGFPGILLTPSLQGSIGPCLDMPSTLPFTTT